MKLECFGKSTWRRLKAILRILRASKATAPQTRSRRPKRRPEPRLNGRRLIAPTWTPPTFFTVAPRTLWLQFSDEERLWGDLTPDQQQALSQLLKGR